MSNGLSAKEQSLLELRQRQLGELLTRRCNMGRSEAHEIAELAGMILTRLQPMTVETLDRRAREMIDKFAEFEWAQAALKRADGA